MPTQAEPPICPIKKRPALWFLRAGLHACFSAFVVTLLIQRTAYDEYETIVFIGKSFGTIVGAKIAAQHNCTLEQVWFTPVPEAYEYVKGNVVAFMGDRDPVMNAEEARKKAAEKNIPLHVYPNADHSLATGNVQTDLDILKDVMTVTGEFLK